MNWMPFHGRFLRLAALLCSFSFALADDASTNSATAAPKDPIPLTRAHAHNDYEHHRPLFDALDCGFCSVEADIFLVKGELWVAHSKSGLRPERTLEKLYLDPLQAQVKQNHGSVYSRPAPFTLLIDIKEEGEAIYPILRATLRRYDPMWTRFQGTNVIPGPITVVLSGDRPTELVKSDLDRDCALDGPIEALEQNWPVTLAPLVSDSWGPTFTWRGKGAFPADQQARLTALVKHAHDQGRRVRFWAIPDRPEVWEVVHRSGVDLVNTDRLPQLRDFLLQADPTGK